MTFKRGDFVRVRDGSFSGVVMTVIDDDVQVNEDLRWVILARAGIRSYMRPEQMRWFKADMLVLESDFDDEDIG